MQKVLAEDAVCREPISRGKFPLTGKNTGNFRALISSMIGSPSGLPSVYGQIRSIPFSAGRKEQGFLVCIREFSNSKQGI
jgi:hypothetical protein